MFTSLKKMARGLFLAFAFAATVFSAVTAVYASSMYPMGQCSGGYCYFLSCGSSAGNYYMKCSQTTGICDDCEENVCNESADYQCQLRGHTKDAGPQQ